MNEQTPKQKAEIAAVVRKAADLYEKWAQLLSAEITDSQSVELDAMPPGIEQAIMLGTIGGCIASNIALMKPETQQWAAKALQESARAIDVVSLFGGSSN